MPARTYRLLLALLPSLPLCACGPEENGGDPPKVPDAHPTEAVSVKIEAFTGGHSKLVWTRYAGGKSSDAYANSDNLELWGIDTRDGLGIRRILADKSNYSRPMISPSGDHIVFTHKGTHSREDSDAKHFDPFVFRTDWSGKHLEKLASGYALDVWRDPSTKVEWVYVCELKSSERTSLIGQKVERFKMLDPSERETVWDKTDVGTENIQLSRDGKRASGLFPWPDAGVMNLEEMTHQKYQHGCWPSLAPDNSYVSWVFDGSHKSVYMFTDGAKDTWTVDLNNAPGLGKHEVYHPRWSNHARFLTMTGPYSGDTIGKSDGAEVEIYVGRFAEDMKSVEAWLPVTKDSSGDYFPDLWVRSGETAGSANAAKSAPKSKPKTAPERDWPVTNLPLLFVWEDRNADNRSGENGSRQSGVEAKERARFGPHFEMLVDGGRFEADAASAKATEAYFSGKQTPFTIEVLATPLKAEQTGIVAGTSHFQIKQRGTDWVFVADGQHPAKLWIGGAKAGVPHHLAIAFDGAEYTAFHNGKPVSQGNKDLSGIEMLAGRRGIVFGSGWDGAVEAVNLAPGRIDESRIEASWKYLEKKIAARKPIPRVRLRGKLLEMTADRPVEALDTYQRGLLGYLYKVEEVLEGSLEADKVVVIHWTIMDRVPLQGFPRRPGETYELVIEPYAAHRELVSERQWNDILEPLDPYYDVETPKE